MKTFITFLLLLSTCSLFGDQEPIVVRLATEVQLLPLYAGAMSGEQSGFSTEYVRQLEKVLRFDLDHNGMTYLAPSSPRKGAPKQISGR